MKVDLKTTGQRPKTIVYACSGCSDAGELADKIARRLSHEGAAEMSCLAGIGGRIRSLVRKGEQAERILVVDGCPLNCAAHTLKLAGFQRFDHLELHKLGLRKGSCPVTDERIAAGVEAAKSLILVEDPLPTPQIPPVQGMANGHLLSSSSQETVSQSQS